MNNWISKQFTTQNLQRFTMTIKKISHLKLLLLLQQPVRLMKPSNSQEKIRENFGACFREKTEIEVTLQLPNPVNSGSVNFSSVWILMRKFSPTPSIGFWCGSRRGFGKDFSMFSNATLGLLRILCNCITTSKHCMLYLSVTGLIWEAFWRQGICLSDLNQSAIRSFNRPQTCSGNVLQKYNQPSTKSHKLTKFITS